MPTVLRSAFLACAVMSFAVIQGSPAAAVDIQWFGQSAFKITTPGGKVIVVDPFITKNPKTPDAWKDLGKLGPVDLILVTHGHGDHVGDTAALAALTGAKVALNADMGRTFATLGRLEMKQMIRFNKSGPIQPLGEAITITMVRAEHSSEVSFKDPGSGKETMHPGGEPAGYIIDLEDGTTIYHAGDTGVFGDMALIRELYDPEIALLPIGGHFTMDPKHAAYAVKTLLKSKTVIPMHYGTFPPLKGTPEEFKAILGSSSAEVVVMEPGEVRSF